jgi:hypothetical protein
VAPQTNSKKNREN